MHKSDIDLFLTRKAKVNYADVGLEVCVNHVVFFEVDKEKKVIKVSLRDFRPKAKKKLFNEVKYTECTGILTVANLHDFAIEYYKSHLDDLRVFAEGV